MSPSEHPPAVEAQTRSNTGGKLELDGIKSGMSLSMVAQKSLDAQVNDARPAQLRGRTVSADDAIGGIDQTVVCPPSSGTRHCL